MDLLYYILSCYGLTQIVVYSKILDSIRPNYYIFHCSMCSGFWLGGLIWFISPYTQLFNFDMSVITGFLLACLSSGTSYILCSIFGDEGIKYERSRKFIDR